MPRYEDTQRLKGKKSSQRSWELAPGSKVWGYLRHSPGDKQHIDSQVAGLEKWCAEQGWNLEHMWIDIAIEGSKEERPQFQAMIAQARQGPKTVDGIVLWAFSRFARDQLDSQFYKADLRKRGYVVVSMVDDIPNNEMAPIYEAFIDWKNQRFLDDLSADVRRGLSYVVDQGYWPAGTPPVGYTTQPEEMGRRRNGEPRMGNRLIKDPALIDRVALAWQMKLTENASYEQIHLAAQLFSNRQHYSHFFSNLLYTGIFVYHGERFPKSWEEGARFCEPYISYEEFQQLQSQRVKRQFRVTSPRVLASDFLLSGLVICGHCLAQGNRVAVTARVDKRRPDTSWYICGVKLRQRGADCTLPRVPCWLLEETIIESLMTVALTPDYVMREIQSAQRLLDERRPQLDAEIARLEQEMIGKEAAVRELLRLIQKLGLSPLLEEEYQRANATWTSASTKLQALRDEARQDNPFQLTEAEVLAYLEDIRNTLRAGEVHTRQALLRRFVKQIILYEDHATLEYTFGPQFFGKTVGLPTLALLEAPGGDDSPSFSVSTVTRTPVYGSGGRRSIH